MELQQRVKLFLGIITMNSMKKQKPTRMCISCRTKTVRLTMLRLQQRESNIIAYQGAGRSFYLCNECINNEKKIKGLSKRFKQDYKQFVKFLKELEKNG
jgi:predicted RNA-binding protein YlxR (DUF448 family)